MTQKRFEPVIKAWTWIYGAGLVLIPPIHLFGKSIFFAEYGLLPFLSLIAIRFYQARTLPYPPRILWLVWISLFSAFLAGIQERENFVQKLSIYNSIGPLWDDHFQLLRDGTRFFRWSLLFSTPWLILQMKTFLSPNARLSQTLLHSIYVGTIISATLSILNYLGYLSLSGFYAINADSVDSSEWLGRSYGTFVSPLEAGLFYGAICICTLTLKNAFNPWNWLIFALSFSGMLLTKSTTALSLALIIGVIYTFGKPSITIHHLRRSMLWIPLLTVIAITMILSFTKNRYLLNIFDFAYSDSASQHVLPFKSLIVRLRTWLYWIYALPQNPNLFFSGLGYTSLVCDNSIITLFVMGGPVLAFSVFFWFHNLLGKIPQQLTFVLLFWIGTWLTLDSIGFWGIGRFMWMLVSLGHLETSFQPQQKDQATESTTARDLYPVH